MELLGQFIFGVIAVLLGYVIHRSFGFNIAGFFSVIPTIYLLMPLLLLTITAPHMSTSAVIESLNLYLQNFAQALPPLLIGHLGGALVCIALGQSGALQYARGRI